MLRLSNEHSRAFPPLRLLPISVCCRRDPEDTILEMAIYEVTPKMMRAAVNSLLHSRAIRVPNIQVGIYSFPCIEIHLPTIAPPLDEMVVG
jgi:hypothetical protein